jgi:hypothetical protein
LSSSASSEGEGATEEVEDGDAVRLSSGVADAVDVGPGLVAVGPVAGNVAGEVAESWGSRNWLAFPAVPAGELLRVCVFTARAAAPVTRIPATDSARAELVLMV